MGPSQKKLILDTLKMENDLKKLISPNSFKRYLSYFDLSLFLNTKVKFDDT